jgi:TPR repeat protein
VNHHEKVSKSDYQCARLSLFKIYRKGAFKLPTNPEKARQMCEAEVKRGNRWFYLHWLLLLQDEGRTAEAITWSRKWVEEGEIAGMKWLAIAYLSGRGVEEDVTKAANLLKQAADLGDMTSQFMYGLCCFHGHGAPLRFDIANSYFSKAAENGHAEANYHLGLMAWNGLGEKRDPAKAIARLKMARDLGSDDAAKFLQRPDVRDAE